MSDRRLEADPVIVLGAINIWMWAEGLSVAEAARRCRLSRTTFWRARQGRPVLRSHRAKIARAVGWPASAFLTRRRRR